MNIICRNYGDTSCRKSRYHQIQQIAKLGSASQAHKFAMDQRTGCAVGATPNCSVRHPLPS